MAYGKTEKERENVRALSLALEEYARWAQFLLFTRSGLLMEDAPEDVIVDVQEILDAVAVDELGVDDNGIDIWAALIALEQVKAI